MKTEFFLEQNFYKGPLRFNKPQVINRKKKANLTFSHITKDNMKKEKKIKLVLF